MSPYLIGVAISACIGGVVMRALGGWPFVACFLFGWLLNAVLAGSLQ